MLKVITKENLEENIDFLISSLEKTMSKKGITKKDLIGSNPPNRIFLVYEKYGQAGTIIGNLESNNSNLYLFNLYPEINKENIDFNSSFIKEIQKYCKKNEIKKLLTEIDIISYDSSIIKNFQKYFFHY